MADNNWKVVLFTISIKSFIMKQFKIVGLSAKHQFLVQDKTGNFYHYPIEGFRVTPDLAFRHYFDDFVGQNI